jgi:hypothetical protein
MYRNDAAVLDPGMVILVPPATRQPKFYDETYNQVPIGKRPVHVGFQCRQQPIEIFAREIRRLISSANDQ